MTYPTPSVSVSKLTGLDLAHFLKTLWVKGIPQSVPD